MEVTGDALIITSEYFLASILSIPVSQKYWRIIPMLLRCSKTVRSRVLTNLPTHIRALFIIARGFRLYMPPDVYRKKITELFTTGALEYFQMYRRVSSRTQPDYSDLIAMTPGCVDNWILCDKILNNRIRFTPYPFTTILNPIDDILYNPGAIKNALNNIFNPNNSAYNYYLQTRVGLTSTGINQSGPYYMATMTTRLESANPMIPGRGHRFYSISELPIDATNMRTYILMVMAHGTPDVVARFYQTFGAEMPTTGAWDRLMFAILFDLDLAIMTSSTNIKINSPE